MASLTDVRLGLRLMAKQPMLTMTIGFALTLGIGLATAGFAFADAVLFSRLPFDPDGRFVRLQPQQELTRQPATIDLELWRLIRSQASTFQHIGGMRGGNGQVTWPGGPVVAARIAGLTPGSLAFVPHRAVLGRPLGAADDATSAPPVVVISERFWRRELAAASDVIGRTLEVDGRSRTLVGVMAADVEFPNQPAVWMPIGEDRLDGTATQPDSDVSLFGVLAPGVGLSTAREQLDGLAARLDPRAGSANPVRFGVRAFTDFGDMALLLATTVVGVLVSVLAVIAGNVGNLMLARSFARSREFALRAALGASRARLVSQIFIEVLIVGAIAGVAGSMLVRALLRQFNAMDDVPFWIDFGGGPLTTALVVTSTLLASALAGVVPALRATRTGRSAGLQVAAGREGQVSFGRTAAAMVVLQIALSVAMLHGAFVMARGFADYAGGDLALPKNQVITANIGLNADRRPANDAPAAIRRPVTAADVLRATGAMTGVVATGLSTALPRQSPAAAPIEIEALPGETRQALMLAPSAEVSAGFLEALGGTALTGRLFEARDSAGGAAPIAVVNEPFARRFFGDRTPLGRRIRVVDPGGAARPGPWREVVGVVPDLGLSLGDATLAAGYYVPLDPETNSVFVVARVSGDPLTYTEPLRRALVALDPAMSITRIERLDDVNLEDRAFFAGVSGVLLSLGVMTLALALAGVYAMMSLVVTRRTREIGIRTALGASAVRVVRSIAGRAALQIAIGGLAGCVLALLSLRGRRLLAARIDDGDAWMLPVVVLVLVLGGLLAIWAPVRRALRVGPAGALRAE